MDIETLAVPDHWFADAEAATRALLQNGAVPKKYEDIWRDVKRRLAELLHGKCWFCETPVPRSDNAVDHFRPKGRVSDATLEHLGYRWLTFERRNFRYACTFCNSRRVDVERGTSGGKADRFPLLDETARVYDVDLAQLDFDDLLATVDCEQAAILDPCSLDDWRLLGCKRENGEPVPATKDAVEAYRVDTSIQVYHLDHEPTCKQRHRVALEFLDAVRDAQLAFLRIDLTRPETKVQFSKHAKRVQRMIDKTAPYSGEMLFLLRGRRSDEHPWIKDLFEV